MSPDDAGVGYMSEVTDVLISSTAACAASTLSVHIQDAMSPIVTGNGCRSEGTCAVTSTIVSVERTVSVNQCDSISLTLTLTLTFTLDAVKK